jgi:two-component system sensor kinase FixL
VTARSEDAFGGLCCAVAFDHLPVGVLIADRRESSKLYWNPAFARIWWGAAGENLPCLSTLADVCADLVAFPEDFHLIPDQRPDAGLEDEQDTILLKRGVMVLRRATTATIDTRDCWLITFEEVDDRVPGSLQLLREWNDTFDALPDHISILSMQGTIIRANRTMRERFGPKFGKLEGLDYRLIYCGTATPDPQPPCAAVLDGHPGVSICTRLPTLEGWFHVASSPIKDAAGVQWGAISIVQDISELKQREQEAEERQLVLNELFKTSLDGIILCDDDGVVRRWNSQAEAILGWSADEVIGRSLENTIVPDELRLGHRAGMERFKLTGAGPMLGQRLELPARHRDGHLIDVELSISAVEVDGRRLVSGFIRDITERLQTERELNDYRSHLESLVEQKTNDLTQLIEQLKREIDDRRLAEAALRWSQTRHLVVLNAVDESIFTLDSTGLITFCNRTPELVTVAEPVGSRFHDVWPDGCKQTLDELQVQLSRERPTATGEFEVVGIDGESRHARITFSLIESSDATDEIIVIYTDLTEQRKAQEQVQLAAAAQTHLARLSALGEMATNIAHEINQPLYAVSNFASAARRLIDAGDVSSRELDELLTEISTEAKRAGDIIHRIRNFAQRRPASPETLQIGDVITRAGTLIENEAAVYGVTINIEGGVGTEFVVRVDRILLKQVFVNTMLNAIQAMAATAGGKRFLAISCRSTEESVVVQFDDTGPGFEDDMLLSCFEAFVTTKPSGTGLGLSISRTIVESHNGRLTVENRDEGGARVTLSLPRYRPLNQPPE